MGDINTNIRIDHLEKDIDELRKDSPVVVASIGNIYDLPKTTLTDEEKAYWKDVCDTILSGEKVVMFKGYYQWEDNSFYMSNQYNLEKTGNQYDLKVYFRDEHTYLYYAHITFGGDYNGIWWYEVS